MVCFSCSAVLFDLIPGILQMILMSVSVVMLVLLIMLQEFNNFSGTAADTRTVSGDIVLPSPPQWQLPPPQ